MVTTSPLRVIQEQPQTGRRHRRPTHLFQVRHYPFVIQPFMIAPVLPGETLKHAEFQARAVTSPIKNALVGWWLEHYLFYVPFSALPHAAEMKELMITEGASLAAISSSANVSHYHKNGPNFVDECLQAVTEVHFREPEVAWNASGLTVSDQNSVTMPLCMVNSDSWLDSALALSAIPTTDGVLDDEFTGLYDQMDERRLMYERIKQLGMTLATYEDWLKMNGVDVPGPAKEARPELIKMNRQWSYPTNTIDPTTGTLSSAVSWAIQDRADKPRLFKEPGFIFGCTITRPKVYRSRQYGNAVSLMSSALNWLPAMVHESAASILEVTKTTGPLGSGVADATSPSENYVVDLRDLLLYGDQFFNFATSDAEANMVALPSAAMNKWYPSSTDINGFFVGSTATTRVLKQDGVVALDILGRQVDGTR